LPREQTHRRFVEPRRDERRFYSMLGCRPQSGAVLAEIVELGADEDDATRLPLYRQSLDGRIERGLAVIAAVAGVLPVRVILHLVGANFLHPGAELRRDPMRVGAFSG
jgi:hypothetical protein